MGLKRVLTTADAAWLVAGNMIGAGIFITPGFVAGRLPGTAWPMAAWIFGGALALCGALIYGELGSRLPRAGGDYQFLAHAFGPLWGFLTGWVAFTLSFSAAVAAMARVVLANLVAAFPGLSGTPLALGAVGGPLLILILTLANTAGARFAGRTTAVFTAVPMFGLLALFAYGLLGRESGPIALDSRPAADPAFDPLSLSAAMIPVFFAYTGWNVAAYVAGEVRDAERRLPRALVLGTVLVTLLYLLLNAILFTILRPEQFAGSSTAFSIAARHLMGAGGERAVSLVIAFAVIGTANVTLMAGSRIYYAMARDGLAPAALARVNRNGVPAVALWAGGLWTAVCALLGSVETLVNWSTMAILLLSSLAVASLFVFRRRDPEAPFHCPGYPWTPAAYLFASLTAAVSSALYEGWSSIYGLLIVLAGLPAYAILRRTQRRHGGGEG